MWVEYAKTRHERLLEEMILEAHRGLSSKSRLTGEQRSNVLNQMRYDVSEGSLLVALNYTLNLNKVELPKNAFTYITESAYSNQELAVSEYAQVLARISEDSVNRYVFTDPKDHANLKVANGLETHLSYTNATTPNHEEHPLGNDTINDAHASQSQDAFDLDAISLAASYVAVLNEHAHHKCEQNFYFAHGLHLLPDLSLVKQQSPIYPSLDSFSLANNSYSFNLVGNDQSLIIEYGFTPTKSSGLNSISNVAELTQQSINDPTQNCAYLGVTLSQYRKELSASYPIAFGTTYDALKNVSYVAHLSFAGSARIASVDLSFAMPIDQDIFDDVALREKVRKLMQIQIVQQSDTYNFVYEHDLNEPILLKGLKEEVMGVLLLSKIDDQFCHISRVYVRPQFRRHGVATALINRAKTEAALHGYNGLLLDTIPTLKGAVKLYEDLGFTRVFFAKYLIKSAHESSIFFAYMIKDHNAPLQQANSTAS